MSKQSTLVVPHNEGRNEILGIGTNKAVLFLCALLSFTIPVFAGNITVVNSSFEDPPPPGTPCLVPPYLGGCAYTQYSAPNGWTIASNKLTVGWFQPGPTGSAFPPYPFAAVDVGPNNAFVNGFSGPLTQTVAATTIAGQVYSLSVDLGWRLDNPDLFASVDLLIGPSVGGTRILATGVKPVQGFWSTFTATFTATTSGLPITIELLNTSSDPLNSLKNGQANFDNVNLSIVPEPGTIAMTAIGMGILALGIRRKRAI